MSCTLPRMRCCRWREVRLETGAGCSVSGDGLIQEALAISAGVLCGVEERAWVATVKGGV